MYSEPEKLLKAHNERLSNIERRLYEIEQRLKRVERVAEVETSVETQSPDHYEEVAKDLDQKAIVAHNEALEAWKVYGMRQLNCQYPEPTLQEHHWVGAARETAETATESFHEALNKAKAAWRAYGEQESPNTITDRFGRIWTEGLRGLYHHDQFAWPRKVIMDENLGLPHESLATDPKCRDLCDICTQNWPRWANQSKTRKETR